MLRSEYTSAIREYDKQLRPTYGDEDLLEFRNYLNHLFFGYADPKKGPIPSGKTSFKALHNESIEHLPPAERARIKTLRAEALKDLPEEKPIVELRKGTEIKQVPGLLYRKSFIGGHEESKLMSLIDKQKWSLELSRRTQQYGYAYNYSAVYESEDRSASRLLPGEPMPDWLDTLCLRLYEEGYFPWKPDQIIINEYKAGQGIAAHTDHSGSFKDVIASLTLNSGVIMIFRNFQKKKQSCDLYLEPRSLVVLENEARYQWTHEIHPDLFDIVKGVSVRRQRRVSITFRKIIESEKD